MVIWICYSASKHAFYHLLFGVIYAVEKDCFGADYVGEQLFNVWVLSWVVCVLLVLLWWNIDVVIVESVAWRNCSFDCQIKCVGVG